MCQQRDFNHKRKPFYYPHTGKTFAIKDVISCKAIDVKKNIVDFLMRAEFPDL